MRSRKSRNSVRKTRKSRGLTVEALHASFEKLDHKVHGMIQKGVTDSELGACIHKSWMELFHIPVSGVAVKALVMHYRASHKPSGKRVTRRRKQTGGMAPLDHMMGQGLTSQSYGRFPVEMGVTPSILNGLDLGRFYESGVGRSCDTTGGHPSLSARQGGGGLWETLTEPSSIMSTIYNGHPPPSVPINSVQSLTNAIQGGPPLGPSASPVASSVQLSTYLPTPYEPSTVSNMPGYQSLYQPAS